ncbi:thioesterase [Brevibacillus reuszeri]|uniref:Thioesterase n=1 Tax=Brevibacillus reuszeri TaxID=54915 RepID=A0A0K9YPY9_9BACL|nr:thioesterase family protein [Brevibacillus reuszeri]KNB70784.1 thioesterase [Brevibacillus reuszeri]MED1857163.1 thioesterase family protein [Brevibacillus reuszeri]GED67015.1 thioesterase [Brevibacillus reuszeri]
MTFSDFELTVQEEAVIGGHVNNVKYLEFLEAARQTWYEYFNRLGFVSFVAHLRVDYKKEAFLGDRLRISTIVHQVGNTSFVLKQMIKNQHDEAVLEAEVTFVSICRETGQKIRVPDALRNLLTAT